MSEETEEKTRFTLARLAGLWWLPAVLIAVVLRFYGSNWDEGQLLHPDEMFMGSVTSTLELPHSLGEWFDTKTSRFNPYNNEIHNYVYGIFPIWLVEVSDAVLPSPLDIDGAARPRSTHELVLIGRYWAATFSVGTVLLLGLLARQIHNRLAGFFASILMALCVLPIQQAHFFTADSFANFFATATLLCASIAHYRNRPSLYGLAGLSLGMAVACRANLFLLGIWLLFVGISHLWRVFHWRTFAWLAGSAFASFVVFRISQPHAFLGPSLFNVRFNPVWLDNLDMVRGWTDGRVEIPFTTQWADRRPLLHSLENIVVWGMGPPLGILGLLGCMWWLIRRRMHPGNLLFLLPLWPLMVILYHGNIFNHTMRYFLPAYPVLILCAVFLLMWIRSDQVRRWLFSGLILWTAIYAVGFVNIYGQTHTRIRASAWIYENSLPGGKVTGEYWDRFLPLPMEKYRENPGFIETLTIKPYDPDSPQKMRDIVEAIDDARYVVLSSRHCIEAIRRMPERYPAMNNFYDRLENDRLGQQHIVTFKTTPRFGRLEWDSSKAEEAYRLYDHPIVSIYAKDAKLWDKNVAYSLLTEDIDFEAIPFIRPADQNRYHGGLFPKKVWERYDKAANPSPAFLSVDSFGNRHPLFVWLFVFVLLGPVSFPIARKLLPAFPDQGWALARLIGLFAITLPAWWLAGMRWIPFHIGVFVSAAAWIGTNVFLWVLQSRNLWKTIIYRRTWILAGELAVWALFFSVLSLRWNLPDLWQPYWGGEKPMDLAFLNATARSPYFPAPNPWLSGGHLNYYGFGFVLSSTLIHLTGVAPTTAYNLLVPTFAATMAAGLATLAAGFSLLWRKSPGRRTAMYAIPIAVIVGGIGGNLGQLRYFWNKNVLEKVTYPWDGFWEASRAIRVPEGEVQPITEFPFFTFLYGDLHAHMMAMPVAMLAMALSWQVFRRYTLWRLCLAATVVGTLLMLNTWDLPIQAAFLVACAVAGLLLRRRATLSSAIWIRCGGLLLAYLVQLVVLHPFTRYFEAPVSEIKPWTGVRSSLGDLVITHGVQWSLLFVGALALLPAFGKLRRAAWPGRLLFLALVWGCFAVVFLVELLHVYPDVGRMNTVFKFSYQVWWIGSVCAAVLTGTHLCLSWRNPAAAALKSAAFAMICLALLYPSTAPDIRKESQYWETDYQGLDGTAYMRDADWVLNDRPLPLGDDLEAAKYLRSMAKPTDVILEGRLPSYQWGSRMSVLTGNPTVLGWDYHMEQQLAQDPSRREIERRRWDVEALFGTEDADFRSLLLDRYQIRYVIVGEVERRTYSEGGIHALTNHPRLTQRAVFGATEIYEVLPASLN